MAAVFSRLVSLGGMSLLVVVLAGCGGNDETMAPEQDELEAYIEENPEILEEEEALDEEMLNEPEMDPNY